jgi:hypothetical protein
MPSVLASESFLDNNGVNNKETTHLEAGHIYRLRHNSNLHSPDDPILAVAPRPGQKYRN